MDEEPILFYTRDEESIVTLNNMDGETRERLQSTFQSLIK